MNTSPVGVRREPNRGLAIFFGLFGILAVLLSLAPGAPAPVWLFLRVVSTTFLIAALSIATRSEWATASTFLAAAVGMVAAVLMWPLALVFIFPTVLAILAVAFLAGSGFGLYVAIRLRRREARRTLEDQLFALGLGRVITVLAVVLTVFVLVPLLGDTAWIWFGCGGKISSSLCG